MKEGDFLDEIGALIDGANKSTPPDKSVTFNMRLSLSLRNDFDKLCKDNHTTMSSEVKRFMRLAVQSQKL
jgi:hypothetical protein